MPYLRVTPHCDGSGTVDAVGEGVSREWLVAMSGVMALKVIVPSELLANTWSFLSNREATRDINKALESGWQGLDIGEIVLLDQIARAHELVEHPAKPGRVNRAGCRCVNESTIVYLTLESPI